MTLQASLNVDLTNLVQGGYPNYEGGTLLTNGSRSGDLATNTVMAKVAASGKWVPMTDVDAADGQWKPRGIYVGPTITEAAIKAADVTLDDGSMLVGGSNVFINQALLVFENSLTLASVLIMNTDTPQSWGTIKDAFREIGLWTMSVIDASTYENA